MESIKNALFGDHSHSIIISEGTLNPVDLANVYSRYIGYIEDCGKELDEELSNARDLFNANELTDEEIDEVSYWFEEFLDEALGDEGIILTHMEGDPACIMLVDEDYFYHSRH